MRLLSPGEMSRQTFDIHCCCPHEHLVTPLEMCQQHLSLAALSSAIIYFSIFCFFTTLFHRPLPCYFCCRRATLSVVDDETHRQSLQLPFCCMLCRQRPSLLEPMQWFHLSTFSGAQCHFLLRGPKSFLPPACGCRTVMWLLQALRCWLSVEKRPPSGICRPSGVAAPFSTLTETIFPVLHREVLYNAVHLPDCPSLRDLRVAAVFNQLLVVSVSTFYSRRRLGTHRIPDWADPFRAWSPPGHVE